MTYDSTRMPGAASEGDGAGGGEQGQASRDPGEPRRTSLIPAAATTPVMCRLPEKPPETPAQGAVT